MSIEEYFTRLMGLFDELARLKPLHGCICNQCTCGLAEKLAADREEEKIHQFLIGLDDDLYRTTRSNLLSQSPPADLDRICQTLVQEERLREIVEGKVAKNDVHVFAVQVERGRPRLARPIGQSRYVYIARRKATRSLCVLIAW